MPMKREWSPSSSNQQKRKLLDSNSAMTDYVLSQLWAWCVGNGMKISSKVELTDKSVHRYGMTATKPIEKSEILFEIPRSLFLWEGNNSYIPDFPEPPSLRSESGWVKLLLVLMFEYTNQESSKWRPYLQLAPDPDVLDTPIFWPADTRQKILGGTSLHRLVENDINNISKEYTNVVLPYIDAHPELGFDRHKHTLDLYTQLVGFVMAYSFTDPDDGTDKRNPPKMVPMADALNHISKHNARLQYDEDCWRMVATKSIQPKEEVFNTFGFLSNSQLLQMYGFVEESSSSETVEIPLTLFNEHPTIPSYQKKWEFLFSESEGVFPSCQTIVIGTKGILSTEETKEILKVFAMTSSEFHSYNGDDWDSSSESDKSDSSEDLVYSTSFESIKKFDLPQKSLLKYVASVHHGQLSRLLIEKSGVVFKDEQDRLRLNKIIVILKGQISILDTLLASCS